MTAETTRFLSCSHTPELGTAQQEEPHDPFGQSRAIRSEEMLKLDARAYQLR